MDKEGGAPLVSIGMPVYNDAGYLREALDSLAGQDFDDYELVISDNASTDGTEAICREYAERDSRIRYHRNQSNIGAIRNFNQAFELTSGKYFMWAGSHDLWTPRFISRCVEVMEAEPEVVLCSPTKWKVNESGEVVQKIPNRLDTREIAGDVVARLVVFLWSGPHSCTVYGLIRSSALKKSGLFQPTFAPDLVLLAELSMLGCIAQIPDQAHSARLNRRAETLRQSLDRYRTTFFPAGEAPDRWYPIWRYLGACLEAVNRLDVSAAKKIALKAAMLASAGRMRGALLSEALGRGRPEIAESVTSKGK